MILLVFGDHTWWYLRAALGLVLGGWSWGSLGNLSQKCALDTPDTARVSPEPGINPEHFWVRLILLTPQNEVGGRGSAVDEGHTSQEAQVPSLALCGSLSTTRSHPSPTVLGHSPWMPPDAAPTGMEPLVFVSHA